MIGLGFGVIAFGLIYVLLMGLLGESIEATRESLVEFPNARNLFIIAFSAWSGWVVSLAGICVAIIGIYRWIRRQAFG